MDRVRREPLKYGFIFASLAAVTLEGWLLISGDRLLISETYFPEREETSGLSFYVPGSEAKYGCTYFTGRKTVFVELSSYQHDECPFIWTEGRILD
jgi:hypothetical protein